MNEIQKIVSLFFGTISGFFIIKSFIFPTIPKIKKLIIHPIKSIKGIEVDHLEILEGGVSWKNLLDRSLALVSDKHLLITQRNKPKLALLTTKFEDNHIIIDGPGMKTLKISNDADYRANEVIQFIVWGQQTEGYYCGEEIEKWFTEYLGSTAKMVKYMDGLKQNNPVVLDQVYEDTKIFYQDLFPIMMINQSSIDALNKKLKGKISVSHRNFRPNFLVEQANAYEEDEWKTIRINGIIFDLPKPCDRCFMTCVDHEKGERFPDNEPLKTLKTYRIDKKWNENSPLFGVNLIPRKRGEVRVGDQVEILEFKQDDEKLKFTHK